jgi:hypothetical protein
MSILKTLLLLLALGSPALAQNAPSDGASLAAGARDAAAQLHAYLEKTAKAGNRPDFSKPPAAGLFGRVIDFKALAALPAPSGSDLPWLLDWGSAANQVNKGILFFGITPPVDPIADGKAIEHNMVELEDPQVLTLTFIVRIFAREFQSMFLFYDQLTPNERTPIREQGFTKARTAGAQEIYYALCRFTYDLKPANERLLSAALGDTAEIWTKEIFPKDRPLVMEEAAKAQSAIKDAAAKKSIAAFSAAMAAAQGSANAERGQGCRG